MKRYPDIKVWFNIPYKRSDIIATLNLMLSATKPPITVHTSCADNVDVINNNEPFVDDAALKKRTHSTVDHGSIHGGTIHGGKPQNGKIPWNNENEINDLRELRKQFPKNVQPIVNELNRRYRGQRPERSYNSINQMLLVLKNQEGRV